MIQQDGFWQIESKHRDEFVQGLLLNSYGTQAQTAQQIGRKLGQRVTCYENLKLYHLDRREQ